jgi:hypothetical protein
MADHNFPVPGAAGYSQGSTGQGLLNTIDGTVALPNNRDIIHSTYGYSEPHNAQDVMGSTVPFTYDLDLMCKSVSFEIKDSATLRNLS